MLRGGCIPAGWLLFCSTLLLADKKTSRGHMHYIMMHRVHPRSVFYTSECMTCLLTYVEGGASELG